MYKLQHQRNTKDTGLVKVDTQTWRCFSCGHVLAGSLPKQTPTHEAGHVN